MNIRDNLARGLVVCACIGLSISLSGCASPRSSAKEAVRAETYSFSDGGGAVGNVFRAVAADGAEALRGVTEVQAGGHTLRIAEDATIDAAGHLVRAEIVITRGCDGPTEEHVTFDRARGTVISATPGGDVEWSVPRDAPWAIAPLTRGGPTPIAAWIGARAASDGESVRVIRADRRSSYRSPADQMVILHERGATVLLDDTVAETDTAFVHDVRALDGGAPLGRRHESTTARACASVGTIAPDVVR
ncbi:Hypothetical protein A7982_00391 [Minicystis rosea]|nr:Hypothetical protein A7982_00391 [Minicystis rosea]